MVRILQLAGLCKGQNFLRCLQRARSRSAHLPQAELPFPQRPYPLMLRSTLTSEEPVRFAHSSIQYTKLDHAASFPLPSISSSHYFMAPCDLRRVISGLLCFCRGCSHDRAYQSRQLWPCITHRGHVARYGRTYQEWRRFRRKLLCLWASADPSHATSTSVPLPRGLGAGDVQDLR